MSKFDRDMKGNLHSKYNSHQTIPATSVRYLEFDTALPSSPIDGEEFVYEAEEGVVWKFRYNAGSASVYKWEFVGGAALYDSVETDEATSGTVFQDLATVGPILTIPFAGDYTVGIGSLQYMSSNTGTRYIRMGIMVNATEALDSFSAGSGHTTTDMKFSASRFGDKTYAAGDVLKARYKDVTADVARFDQRWMTVIPKRIG